MKQVLEAVADLGTSFGTKAVAEHDAVEIGTRQVLEHLKTLVEREYLAGEVDGTGYTWRDDWIHRVNEYGDAELGTVDLEDLPEEDTDEL